MVNSGIPLPSSASDAFLIVIVAVNFTFPTSGEASALMSPASYIANVRINAAKTLLGTTDRRISDIASDVGFFDHSHFIRTFKRIVGATPAKYRRNLTMRAHGGNEP